MKGIKLVPLQSKKGKRSVEKQKSNNGAIVIFETKDGFFCFDPNDVKSIPTESATAAVTLKQYNETN
jgi:hypothetical protein